VRFSHFSRLEIIIQVFGRLAMLVSGFLASVFLIILLRRFSLQRLYDKAAFYYNVFRADFETFNKLAVQNIVIYNELFFKVAFVNNFELVKRVLNSDLCIDKPYSFYKFFDLDLGMIAAICKFNIKALSKAS